MRLKLREGYTLLKEGVLGSGLNCTKSNPPSSLKVDLDSKVVTQNSGNGRFIVACATSMYLFAVPLCIFNEAGVLQRKKSCNYALTECN